MIKEALAATVLVLATTAVPASAAPADEYTYQLLGKAAADECFAGIGVPYPSRPPCTEGQPKVNQSYVWGLTRVGDQVWFGTGANVHCLTSGGSLGEDTPVVNDDYVCEYGESQIADKYPTVPDELGDVRPPQFWLYDAATGALTNESGALTGDDLTRLRNTLGLRSAGNLNGVVLFAGPSLSNTLNVFAFDASTRQFLGSQTLALYSNARTFLVAEESLYLGVGTGLGGGRGGAVLRWIGTRAAPFLFDKVADLPTQAADLAYLDGHLYATTWSSTDATTTAQLGGVWKSPVLPIRAWQTHQWTQVFDASRYETDPLIRTTYGFGGVAAYGGYLYWGSMHVPLQATLVHQATYPQPTDDLVKLQARNTQRGLSIWRGKDLGTPNQKIELLYGESALPAYDPTTSTWSAPATGWTPLYGRSGFNNVLNNYTWRMTVAGDRLFVGTMDWSYLVHDLLPQAPPTDPALWGSDLWVFTSTTAPAQPINTIGQGNYLNYGIRNMAPDGDDLYLGMANPMNLRADPTDDIPEGGWELIKLNRS
ncbi:hypothetical protein [Actinoplanes sp. NPDC051851]|uniref:hypothetical protein n=1 Tax=Actinoplanes sp. NPDC051851 TaxID=3154753 RepID=UPI00343031FA